MRRMSKAVLLVTPVIELFACDAAQNSGDDAGLDALETADATPDVASDVAISDAAHAADAADAETRDARVWPFAVDSIWNTPIGSGAVYVDAKIVSTGGTVGVDEDIIVLHPEVPLVDLYVNNAGWSGTSRCNPTGGKFDSLPIPSNYVFDPVPSTTPNAGLAALRPDGHTIAQNQPFSHCIDGGVVTSGGNYYLPPDSGLTRDQDIFGPGAIGAHGGSGLSAIGGAIRLGELRPGGAEMRHALKIELWKQMNFLKCNTNPTDPNQCNFVWPAITGEHNPNGPTVSAMRFGALLALRPSFDPKTLKTEAARHIAWTLQNYGGYIVDDTAWAAYALVVETGPDGAFQDQFKTDYGFTMFANANANATWKADMEIIFQALAVVTNNTAKTPGGGGTPRQPPAPSFE